MTRQSNGGIARAAALSPERRSDIAKQAAAARWGTVGAIPKAASLRALVSRIERHKAAIGRHRDALQELMSDLEATVESVDDAHDSLTYAIDRLSETL